MSESEDNTPEDAALPLARIPQLQPLIDFLPPWGEATAKQKMRLIGYSLIVYLPVALLIMVVIGVLACYCFCLLWPMAITGDDRPELYFWHSSTEHRESRILAGILAFLQFLFLTLFLISFYKASFTNPGHIPESDDWDINVDKLTEESPHAKFLLERKLTTGAIRTCSRCNKVKPDRCHHCRLCDQCVLKMDHHCPWIANCVGFFNYKYFFLMVTYGMLSLWVFEASFWMAVLVALRDDEVGTVKSFGLTVVYLLCGVLAAALTLFWMFHLYLISQATTTVEFCEKRNRKSAETLISPYVDSLSNNFRNALGQRCLLWCLPCCTVYIGYRTIEETGTIFKLVNAAGGCK